MQVPGQSLLLAGDSPLVEATHSRCVQMDCATHSFRNGAVLIDHAYVRYDKTLTKIHCGTATWCDRMNSPFDYDVQKSRSQADCTLVSQPAMRTCWFFHLVVLQENMYGEMWPRVLGTVVMRSYSARMEEVGVECKTIYSYNIYAVGSCI